MDKAIGKTCYCYLLCMIFPVFLIGSPNELLDDMIKKGNQLYRDSPDSARSIVEVVLETSANKLTLGEAYFLQGKILNSTGTDNSSALVSFYSALDNFLLADYDKGIAKTLKKIGLCYYRSSNYEYAATYFHEELGYRRELSEAAFLGDVHFNIALTSYQLSQHSEAISYFENSIEIFKTIGEQKMVNDANLNLAISYFHDGQTEKSFQLLRGLNTENSVGNYFQGLVYSNLGSLYLDVSQLDSAKFYLNVAESSKSLENNPVQLIRLYRDLVKYYLIIDKDNIASIDYLEKSINLTPSSTDQAVLLDCFDQLIELYRKLGNEELALITESKLGKVASPLAKQALEQEKMHLAYKMRMIKHQRDKQLLERRNDQLEVRLLYLIIGLLITAIICYLIIRWLYRGKQSKQDTIEYLKEKDAMLIYITKTYNIDTAKIARRLNKEYRRGFKTFETD
ncbi:MAG: tetratricopeptide repeat protein [Cytophagales bacterium]|nr:tetratricopeptide repeat protein [Cytophagales bacterium]